MDFLVEFFVDVFGNINKELAIFIISLMPILELRGGLLAASLLNIDFVKAVVICVIGNVLPIPIVLLFLKKILELFEKWHVTKRIVIWLEKKVDAKREQIDKYGYLGLTIFVGIPLPGTGAWTGSLLAVMLGMDRKKSFVFILLGVVMAAVIMSILSYGILGNLL